MLLNICFLILLREELKFIILQNFFFEIFIFTISVFQEWYSASKVIAEKMALEYAEKKGLNVVTVCPCLVFGPQLQPTVNTSNELLIYITKGFHIISPFVTVYSEDYHLPDENCFMPLIGKFSVFVHHFILYNSSF